MSYEMWAVLGVGALELVFLPIVWRQADRLRQIEEKLAERITRDEAGKMIAESISGMRQSVDTLHADVRLLISTLIQER